MKLYTSITKEVEINPMDVISNLITDVIGKNGDFYEKNGLYFAQIEASGGGRTVMQDVEITKQQYAYIKSLFFILQELAEYNCNYPKIRA